MRALVQPGPVHPQRTDSFVGQPQPIEFVLEPGQSLNAALTAPLVAAGMQCATITFSGGTLSPFHYVLPGPPDGPQHVAYFSAPHAATGETRVELACATFGWSGSEPLVHIHGAWIEPDGTRRGGHMLPMQCIVARPMPARACGFADVRMAALPDAETNFTLLQPQGNAHGPAPGIVARVRPNEDITLALESIAAQHGIRDAVVHGSVGSLIGAHFTSGQIVDDFATEVLVRGGTLRNGAASLDLVVADMQGRVHTGTLMRGENPVLITFDLVLESRAPR